MRVRSNYGIIGPLQQPVFYAGGIYQIEDQRLAKSTGLWPKVLPPAYEALIQGFSGTKLIVDALVGNDANNGITLPFATVDAAIAKRNTLTTSNVMIVIKAGTYTVTPQVSGFGSYILNDISSTYSTIVVCDPGRVILQWNAGTTRDAGTVTFQSTNSAVYGAIFKRDNNAKTTTYTVAFCNSESTKQLGPLYNCVWQETNANGNWSLVYNNGNTVTGTINNCTFAVTEASLGDYTSAANQVFNNCLYNWTYTSTGAGTSTQNNPVILSSHDLSFTTYSSPNAAGSGVYYGTYAWPAL